MLLGSGPDSAHARRVKLVRCQLGYSRATFRIRPVENPMVRAVQSRSAYYKGVFGVLSVGSGQRSPSSYVIAICECETNNSSDGQRPFSLRDRPSV